jgi:hypothetical protein
MRLKLVLLSLALLALPTHAQETVTLTTPETKPTNTTYRVSSLILDVDAGMLSIGLTGATGDRVNCTYSTSTTPTGATLITGLNKANLATAYAGNATTGSLKQRIFHRLVTMGEAAAVCGKALAGTLTGTVP